TSQLPLFPVQLVPLRPQLIAGSEWAEPAIRPNGQDRGRRRKPTTNLCQTDCTDITLIETTKIDRESFAAFFDWPSGWCDSDRERAIRWLIALMGAVLRPARDRAAGGGIGAAINRCLRAHSVRSTGDSCRADGIEGYGAEGPEPTTSAAFS